MGIPSTCKAAALVQVGAPLQILDVEVPDQLEPGGILVEVQAATVCATDVHKWDGSFGSPNLPGPVVLGHEMVGRVVRLGEGVSQDSIGDDLAVGDRIIWSHGFCGQCVACVVERQPTLCERVRSYMVDSCREYPYLTGGFAQYCYVFPTAGRVKVPDAVSDATAAASGCAFRTMVQGFDRLGRIDDRQAVVIQGSGPLGLFASTLAVNSGSSNIIVIGGPTARLELARKWGAHHTVDIAEVPSSEDRLELIRGWTNGRGPDVVIEASGVPQAFGEGVAMARLGGRYLIIGQTHSQAVPFVPSQLMIKHLTLIGSRGAAVEHYQRALSFMVNHRDRFGWDEMISSYRPLEEINESMERMQRWEEIKPAIVMAS